MARARYVLRYRGDGPKPDADVARVRELAGADVVDASPRMLVVESEPTALGALVDDLSDWVMAPEQAYEMPDTREQVERPPG